MSSLLFFVSCSLSKREEGEMIILLNEEKRRHTEKALIVISGLGGKA